MQVFGNILDDVAYGPARPLVKSRGVSMWAVEYKGHSLLCVLNASSTT